MQHFEVIKEQPYHLCNASVCEDVTCMYKPVEHLCCLLYQVTLIGVIFKFLIYQINGI